MPPQIAAQLTADNIFERKMLLTFAPFLLTPTKLDAFEHFFEKKSKKAKLNPIVGAIASTAGLIP
jgi:hypothetical protein